ncbi:salutaridinol 7-O-acetyltransferase-like [Papaver somniferum]|uniref:salutaridinol 7-O-acetyltransferase-like n=1 Tax=Papaver somniferum TaxID=3469 RepID=UPI000E6FE665|nr:salutaridinol 7-O-acetyltransferase-like [Papaver somniferum]
MPTMSSAAVEVISKETIKPTTPTPFQLRNFNLSLLDQYFPPVYVPIILFYPAVANSTGSKHHDDLALLKRSLSETLVHFYPMAGRTEDNMVVDCNDEGIDFVEVKIKGNMCEFMIKPDVTLNLLVPSEVVSTKFVKGAQVIVQVNMFDCGGTAICLCISHKIADFCTMSTFIRNWAGTTNTARYGGATTNQNLLPSFESASLFPPSEQLVSQVGVPPSSASYPTEVSTGYKVVSKRFVFDAEKITSVREKLQVLMHDKYKCRRPTKVEAVTALIWKAAIISTSAGSLSAVHHAVNYRKRTNPPLLDVSFGNLCGLATVVLPATTETRNTANKTSTSSEIEVQEVLDDQFIELVAQLRGEINKVKGDNRCMEKMFLDCVSAYDDFLAKNSDVEVKTLPLLMTSWCKFGLYDADFGWGKPIWVTTNPFIEPSKNIIFMNDTKCGEGIEVWANFLEDHMANFELHLSEILELF